METIVAAALIAVGIVVAALVYARTHRAHSAAAHPQTVATVTLDPGLPERTNGLTRREDALAVRESDLERYGEHSESGRYTLATWLAVYTEHPRTHAAQLLEAVNA